MPLLILGAHLVEVVRVQILQAQGIMHWLAEGAAPARGSAVARMSFLTRAPFPLLGLRVETLYPFCISLQQEQPHLRLSQGT